MSVNKILVNNNDSNYTHSIFDISEYTGNSYSTLSDAINDIPQLKRKGGMTIRYVQTNDNKYVQYRLIATSFSTTVANWQGVDDEPTVGSENLVKSRGVFDEFLNHFNYKFIEGEFANTDSNKLAIGENPNFKCVVATCSQGDAFEIQGTGGNSARLWALYDDEENLIQKADFTNIKEHITITIPAGIGYIAVNTKSENSFVLNKNYNVTDGDKKLSGRIDAQNAIIAEQNSKIGKINDYIDEESATFEDVRFYNSFYPSKLFPKGCIVVVNLTKNTTWCVINAVRLDDSYFRLGEFEAWETGEKSFLIPTDCKQMYVYASETTGGLRSGKISVLYEGGCSYNIKKFALATEKQKINLLVLGDSYSYREERYLSYVKGELNLGTYVNLAVAGATLKDAYADRQTYPYDGRPRQSGATGNVNTINNQIAKLQRLMLGTDLDEGETQIYTKTSDYPDVIIIEGGKNDWADVSDENYVTEMWNRLENVYFRNLAGNTVLGVVNVPKDVEECNRTNFAGTMYYQYRTLHDTFPNARIFFITPSGIHYASAQNMASYQNVANQIRKSASYLCTPTINWDLEGRISFVDNDVPGSGTQADPYIINSASEYTVDSLHPNAAGGVLLGECVIAKLRGYDLL